MKKIIINLFVVSILSFCFIHPALAYITLQDDGTMFIPQVRIGAKYYSASLKKENSTGLTPEFVLQNIDEVTLNSELEANAEHANFDPNSGVLNIPNFLSGIKTYSLALKATDSSHQRFIIQHMAARDEVIWLYMISGSPNVSYKNQGTYGNTTVGKHFTIDINANIVQFSDRPHRLASNFPDGIVGFNDFYALSDFLDNPPNVTFAGVEQNTGTSDATVFEMSTPFIYQDLFVVPVVGTIGSEKLPPEGDYIDASFVVDPIATTLSCPNLGDILEDGSIVISVDTDCISGVAAMPTDLDRLLTWNDVTYGYVDADKGLRLPTVYELLDMMVLDSTTKNLNFSSQSPAEYWSSNENTIDTQWDAAYIGRCCRPGDWDLVEKTQNLRTRLVQPFTVVQTTIEPFIGGSISGIVTLQGRTDFSGITVTLTGPSQSSTTTLADGSFTFTDLLDGNYTVNADLDPGYIYAEKTAINVFPGSNIDLGSVELLAGDYDNNESISFSDLALLQNYYFTDVCAQSLPEFDFDGDCFVSISEFNFFQLNFNLFGPLSWQ